MYEHNLWSYVYYIIMIEDKIKNNKNLNKVEKYVFNLYKKKVYSWLPLNRSITLGNLKIFVNWNYNRKNKEETKGTVIKKWLKEGNLRVVKWFSDYSNQFEIDN
jgi:hypothetical protein